MELAKFDVTEAGLTEMETYTSIEITDKESFDVVKKYRSVVRKLRTTIEKRKKELKAPIIKQGKEIEAMAKTLFARIKVVEDNLVAKITIEEDKIELEKQKLIQAEQERIEKIDAAYKDMEDLISSGRMFGLTASELNSIRNALKLRDVSEEIFQERTESAQKLKEDGYKELSANFDIAVKLEQDKADAEKKQAEIEEKYRKLAEKQEKQKKEENARKAELLKEKKRFEAEKAEFEAKKQAEADRLKAIEEAKARKKRQIAERDAVYAQAIIDNDAYDKAIQKQIEEQEKNKKLVIADSKAISDFATKIGKIKLPKLVTERGKSALYAYQDAYHTLVNVYTSVE